LNVLWGLKCSAIESEMNMELGTKQGRVGRGLGMGLSEGSVERGGGNVSAHTATADEKRKCFCCSAHLL